MNAPVNVNSASGAEALFNESIGGFEMLQQVLVLDVVDLDLQMLVVFQ
jgi:hypothetical protein